ncbi:MAG: Sec-independent protein translocase subunit TatA [Micrococcaceae bacterium]
MRLSMTHLLIIIAIALIIFGAPRLPGIARSMGQSLRVFKSEVRQMKDEDKKAKKAKEEAEAQEEEPEAIEATVVKDEEPEVEIIEESTENTDKHKV